MLIRCPACQTVKDENEFSVNRSIPSGRQSYCKPCRSAYAKKGRVWPTRSELNQQLLDDGFKRCPNCEKILSVGEFKKSSHTYDGLIAYCRPCSSEVSRKAYSKPEAKARAKAYYSRPEVIERVKRQERETPRRMLNIALNKANKRRPHPDNVTIHDLMEMWEMNGGKCAVSRVPMTWRQGPAKSTSISIDRIDSSLGYVKGNVRLVCCSVNTFKGRWPESEMLAMARAIVAHADSTSPSLSPRAVEQTEYMLEAAE